MDDTTRAAGPRADTSACPAETSAAPLGGREEVARAPRPARRVVEALRGLAESSAHRDAERAPALHPEHTLTAPTNDDVAQQPRLRPAGPATGHRGVVAPHRSGPPPSYSRGHRPVRPSVDPIPAARAAGDFGEPESRPDATDVPASVLGAVEGMQRLGRLGWARVRSTRLGAHLVPHHGAGPLVVDAAPTDTMVDVRDALAARRWAQASSLGSAGPLEAWAAQGALAALALVDDRRLGALHRSALPPTVVDRSGDASPFAAWAVSLGYDVLQAPLGLAGRAEATNDLAELRHRPGLDVAPGSVDLLTRLYPCTTPADSIDDALVEAGWALSRRGLAVVTVVLTAAGERSVGPAEVQALVARADALGLRLVGHLDGGALRRVNRVRSIHGAAAAADPAPTGPGPVHALVRLAFRSTR